MHDLITDMQGLDEALQALLVRHEGLRLKPYRSTVGKLTIGVCCILTNVDLSQDEGPDFLAYDLQRARAGLDRHHSWWRLLDLVRHYDLTDLAFKLGPKSLNSFALFLTRLRAGAHRECARKMLRSPVGSLRL